MMIVVVSHEDESLIHWTHGGRGRWLMGRLNEPSIGLKEFSVYEAPDYDRKFVRKVLELYVCVSVFDC